MKTRGRRRAIRHANDDLLTWLLSKLSSIEGLEKWLGLTLKLSLLYGGAWIFQYCYFGIKFTPVDLSIGDGIYWIFAAAAISLMTLLLAAMGLLYLLPWVQVLPGGTRNLRPMHRAQLHPARHRASRLRRRWNGSGVMDSLRAWRQAIKAFMRDFLAARPTLERLVRSPILLWSDFGAWCRRRWVRELAALLVHIFAACLMALPVYVAIRLTYTEWLYGFGLEKWNGAIGTQAIYTALSCQLAGATLMLRVRRHMGWMDAAMFGIVSAIAYFLLSFALSRHHFALLATMLFGGAFLGLMLMAIKGSAQGRPELVPMAWLMGLMMLFAPMLAGFSAPADSVNFLSKMVFQQLGLAAYETSAVVTGEAAKSIKELIDHEQVKVIYCELDEGKLVLSGIDLPWQGLGQKTLLALPRRSGEVDVGAGGGDVSSATSKAASGAVRLALPADQITAFRTDEPRCASLPTRVYFQFGTDVPSDVAMLAQLQQDLDAVQEVAGKGWHVGRVILTARSDQRPLPGSQNDQLARRRAMRVLRDTNILGPGSQCGKDAPDVDVELIGSREPIRGNCGVRGDGPALAECEAANRVVQVRVMLERVGK